MRTASAVASPASSACHGFSRLVHAQSTAAVTQTRAGPSLSGCNAWNTYTGLKPTRPAVSHAQPSGNPKARASCRVKTTPSTSCSRMTAGTANSSDVNQATAQISSGKPTGYSGAICPARFTTKALGR